MSDKKKVIKPLEKNDAGNSHATDQVIERQDASKPASAHNQVVEDQASHKSTAKPNDTANKSTAGKFLMYLALSLKQLKRFFNWVIKRITLFVSKVGEEPSEDDVLNIKGKKRKLSFRNMQIKTKLLAGFITVGLLAGVIGGVGITGLNEVGNRRMQGLDLLLRLDAEFMEIRAHENYLLNPRLSVSERAATYEQINAARGDLDNIINEFQNIQLTSEEAAIWEALLGAYAQWDQSHSTLMSYTTMLDSIGVDNPQDLQYQIALLQRDQTEWIWRLSDTILNTSNFSGIVRAESSQIGRWLIDYSTDNENILGYIENLTQPLEGVYNSVQNIREVMSEQPDAWEDMIKEIYDKEIITQQRQVMHYLSQIDTYAQEASMIYDTMLNFTMSRHIQNANHASELISELVVLNTDSAYAAVARSLAIIIITTLVALLLAIILGILISLLISRPINRLKRMADKIAVGDIEMQAVHISGDEIGDLTRSMQRMADNIRKDAEVASQIAQGEFAVEITPKSGKDVMAISLKQAVTAVSSLAEEAEKMTEAAVAGQLSARGNAEAFTGGYRQIIEGVNATLDAVVSPIQEASVVLEDMAAGNLDKRVEGDYQGDHAIIKDALNTTLDSLGNYVHEISTILNEMSQSNFAISVEADYQGDFEPIKTSLNEIIATFNKLLLEMNRAAEQVAAGARQVSDGSQSLSQGATEQASSIEQLTASMMAISEQTRQNALSANEVNQLVSQTANKAGEGNESMQQMQQAMREISNASASISKIIKVIDDIAFQTNILALNAAVEAARAGTHGRGFAVVAEEVRNLAARSAQAASETTDLIENSISKTKTGTTIADSTAKALTEIVADITSAAELVGQIAEASNDQATAITQVNQGVDQVSNVVQSNSATSEQSAAISEELSSQAETLQAMIAQFNLKLEQA